MNTTITGIVALLIGLGGGYFIGSSQAPAEMSHSMSDAMAGMTAGLEGKVGNAFDQAFLDEMIVHHEGAVEMAKQALDKASHSEIRQMATDIITAQTSEINTMREWLSSWFGQ